MVRRIKALAAEVVAPPRVPGDDEPVSRRARIRNDIDSDIDAEGGAPARASYAPAFGAGFAATASSVQQMHEAISGKTFDSLLRVPGLTMPTRIVQGVHDAITQGVYAAVRHGGGYAFSLAADAERLAVDPYRVVGTTELAARSALNGAFGDSLAASRNGIAVSMGLHANGKPLAITRRALASLSSRVCVFLHGLACDEQSWSLRTDAWGSSAWSERLEAGTAIQYGALLEGELGVSAIYLRYNSGISLEGNAIQFAELLERVADAAPQVEDWVLIGHSMGGLVSRRAHAIGAAEGMGWPARTSQIVCLGSPHQGAPLAKIGSAVAGALNRTDVTRPLARLADARSRGIKDLQRGLRRSARAAVGTEPALRLVFATLGDESSSAMGSFFGKMFGDGLVMAGSAGDIGVEGDGSTDVQRVEIPGLGHMGLLNHPRVYAVLRGWLGAPASS